MSTARLVLLPEVRVGRVRDEERGLAQLRGVGVTVVLAEHQVARHHLHVHLAEGAAAVAVPEVEVLLRQGRGDDQGCAHDFLFLGVVRS